MPSRRSRRAVRRINHGTARVGTAIAVAATAGVAAAAGPAAAQVQAPVTPLRQGSAGLAVKRVQHALRIRSTGHFGRSTKGAVVGFQRKDGLLVDGIVGPQTWAALFGSRPRSAAMPAAAAAVAPSTPAPETTSSSGAGGYAIPAGIVQCESGGNYSAVNPQTGAGGAYQILPSTWSAYGGQGLPQDAPAAEQDRIASQIYASEGASAWSC